MISIRKATQLAEGHAIGILESTDDYAFWGEDFYDEHGDDDWKILQRARDIVLNRLRRKISDGNDLQRV